MALTADPTLVVTGTVRSLVAKTFTDKVTGEFKDSGRDVLILTTTGALVVRVPPIHNDRVIEVGDFVVWHVTFSIWSFEDRSGVTFRFVIPVGEPALVGSAK